MRHQLAMVAGSRYTVEQCIEEAKGETDFVAVEVRTWPRWYRHITLTLLAHAWLANRRQQATLDGQAGKKSR